MRLVFQGMHVRVAEAEMMTHLVDQDMPDEMFELLSSLGPLVEDRTPIEEDLVGKGAGFLDALFRQRPPRIEARQFEGIIHSEAGKRLFIGKFLDLEDDALQVRGEGFRQSLQSGPGDGFDFGSGGWWSEGTHRLHA